ncbi:hypothetical protein TeGR_g5980 [Tetraparma gracilis]|uniref:Mitochondrial inner membrane protease ATP23 n=1 Tax=Tetraparma gracilis TaxID=2962635 RepID=A0ABQ6MV88_9STRA|nr:hypothetical protein TeGR_g5980 [Tetraparma gracilis]
MSSSPISVSTDSGDCLSRCRRHLARLTSHAPTATFLLEALGERGCGYGGSLSSLVECAECPRDSGMAGGFAVNIPKDRLQSALRDKSPSSFGGGPSLLPSKASPTPTIVVCANHVQSYADFHNIVAHELIHAVDQCRVKDVDFKDVRQHACSEVRASNLSGECSYWQEVQRGVFNSRGGQQSCVKRRAALSVKQNPNLGGEGEERRRNAERVVGEVFERCYRDTAPFMRHPNAR